MRFKMFAAAAAVAVVSAVSTTPASAIKLNIVVGPYADPHVYVPRRRCHWEKRRGPCYKDAVCVRRNKRGRCRRIERRRVCETRRVRVCY